MRKPAIPHEVGEPGDCIGRAVMFWRYLAADRPEHFIVLQRTIDMRSQGKIGRF